MNPSTLPQGLGQKCCIIFVILPLFTFILHKKMIPGLSSAPLNTAFTKNSDLRGKLGYISKAFELSKNK
jgi:hypothetical protein